MRFAAVRAQVTGSELSNAASRAFGVVFLTVFPRTHKNLKNAR
jgi:hypothetical protein